LKEGLKAILVKQGFDVVGDASEGWEAVAKAVQLRPDIVLMDVSMPRLNGIGATQRLLAELPEMKIIALSMHADRRYVMAMLAAGARGYVLKSSVSDELLEAIPCVQANGRYVSPQISGIEGVLGPVPALPARTGEPPPRMVATELTAREREVLQLIAEGMASKEIGGCLGITANTVETHRRHIMEKLHLRSVAELTKYALREGLTSLD
jgi:DNA-binding NarL/FixJ family response regulator